MKIKDLNNTIINAMIQTGTVIDCKEGYMEITQQNLSEPTLTISVPSTVTVGMPTTITVTASVVGDITVYINQEYYQTSIGQSTMSFTYTPEDTFTIEAYFSSTQGVSVNASQEIIPEGALSYAVQSFDRYGDNYNPAFQYYLYHVAGIAANETYTTQDEADAVTTLTEPIFRRTEYLEDPTSIPYTYFIGSDIDNKTRVDKIPFTSLDELDNFSNLTEINAAVFTAYDGETSGDNKIWNGVQVQSYRFPDSLERVNMDTENPAHQGLVSVKCGGNVRLYQNGTETTPYYLIMICGYPSHFEMSGDIDTTIEGVNVKMFVRDNVIYADIPMSGMVMRLITPIKNNIDTDEFTPYLSPMSTLFLMGNGSSDDVYIKYSNANIQTITGNLTFLGYNNTIHIRSDIDTNIYIADSGNNIIDYNTYTPIENNGYNIDINPLCQGTLTMVSLPLNNTTLSIPANLKGFKFSATEMPYLTSLTVSPDNTYVSYSNGFLANYDGTITYFPSLVSDVSTMDIPEGVNTIPSNFMEGNTNLEELSLPSTLTYISSRSFYNCFNLADLTISEGTTELGSEAFTNADALTTLTLPSTLREIDYQALAGLNSLTELVVPEGVTTTEAGAFMINTSLYTLDLPSTFNRLGYYSLESSDSLKNIILRNPTPPAMYGGIAIKYHINGHDSEGGARALSSYDLFVPDASVVAYQADSNWGQLNVRPLSEYVRTEPFYINLTIGSNKHFALDSNTQFVVNNTTLNIPSQLESMNVSNISFPNLTNVVIAEDNTHFAFFNGILYCDGNVVIDTNPPIPQTYACQSIDSSGANYNPALQEYLYDSGIASNSGYTTTTEALNLTEIEARGLEGKTNLTSLVNILSNFPNLVRISNNAFRNCTNLRNVDIPSSVTYLGATAFEGCTSLETCYLDNSQIDNLHASTFWGCSALTTVTLPSTQTYIGESAFHNCGSLIGLYCYATTPPEVYTGAFDDKSNIRLYVPSASISAYQSSTYWQGFRSYNAI